MKVNWVKASINLLHDCILINVTFIYMLVWLLFTYLYVSIAAMTRLGEVYIILYIKQYSQRAKLNYVLCQRKGQPSS